MIIFKLILAELNKNLGLECLDFYFRGSKQIKKMAKSWDSYESLELWLAPPIRL